MSLRTLQDLFLSHPRTLGETYAEHGWKALRFGGTMIVGGCACLVHALVPALCSTSASERVKKLYLHMRARQPNFAEEPAAFQSGRWQPEYEI